MSHVNLVMHSLAWLCIAFSPSVLFAKPYQRNFESVLGTSLELLFEADSAESAQRIERVALAEIDRLALILSSWDANSELMRWQSQTPAPTRLSQELTEVLRRAEYWRSATHGAFEVRAGHLTQLWRQGTVPSDAARRKLVRQFAAQPYSVSNEGLTTRYSSLSINLDGLAKGYLLDAVCREMERQFPELRTFTINLGGDLRKLGHEPLAIAISDPQHPHENAETVDRFSVDHPVAMATSGGYRRFVEIDHHKHSHIVDPRTGLPASNVLSSTVLAPNAMDADALATALSVLSPKASLELVNSLDATECLLILSDGCHLASAGWPSSAATMQNRLIAIEDTQKPQSGLIVHFTLERATGGRYRRPYVAIWLEDTDGFPVKTALLWMQTEQPGPRWHRDLTRWYRSDRTRKLIEKEDLIGTISSATRGPGEYSAHFDGTDNNGHPLQPGKYTLCLEVAREHGTYQIIREPIEWKNEAIDKRELKGNVEMSHVSLQYIPVGSKSASPQDVSVQ
ncbi:DUF2271 domain-containing protein [Aureliella helgolandensis]|uniref:FAD:protein FMN transferase n=1 Tax=Aureliella helgolandensis TaxID=2527968 RepID=A0A518G551_9BACT|nr:DUF2271 domain-containing protein [Aureliella helgolandensis]QDV23724.1 Thiamine biosynthesis lipoprotein ApbE precursor [Aureliella helgolandensis]